MKRFPSDFREQKPGYHLHANGNHVFECWSHLVVGDLQQVQHDFMSTHVLQQPLLLLPHTTAAHLVQPLKDLRQNTTMQHNALQQVCCEHSKCKNF